MSLLPQALKLLVIWIIGATLLGWGRLPALWRWRLALLASAAGVVFLILGMNSEGLRQAPTMAVVVLGTPYITGQVSASASLPYYLVTAVCLLLGSLGLAVGDELAAILRRRWLLTAVAVSFLVTALRFLLEKVAAPPSWARAVGIVWLAPVVGACFVVSARDEAKGLAQVARALVAYAFIVRSGVAALIIAATSLRLGSHYDVSPLVRVRLPFSEEIREFVPGSLEQILSLGVFPQLLIWPVYTIVSGLLAAWVVWLLVQGRQPPVPQARAPLPIASSPDGSHAV